MTNTTTASQTRHRPLWWRRLTWLLLNSLMLLLTLSGILGGLQGCINLAVGLALMNSLMVGVMAFMFFTTLWGTQAKQEEGRLDDKAKEMAQTFADAMPAEPPVPSWVRWSYDLILLVLLVWSGWFFTSLLWIIGMVVEAILWSSVKGLRGLVAGWQDGSNNPTTPR